MVLMIALVSAFVIGAGLVMAAYVGTTKVPGMLAQRKLNVRLQSLSAPVDGGRCSVPARWPRRRRRSWSTARRSSSRR